MTTHETDRHLQPTPEAGHAFLSRRIDGGLVMLNLLRFRAVADYSGSPELAPDKPIRGVDAYDLYVAHTLPFLKEGGGELLFVGAGGPFLIGPRGERWDQVMLIRQKSVEAFMAFATNEAYLVGLGHRMAALEDSRLLPLVELPRPNDRLAN